MPEDREHTPLASLRSYELRLLSCTLPPPPSSSVNSSNCVLPPPVPSSSSEINSCSDYDLQSLIEDVLASIESGNYLKALSSDACQSIFNFDFKEASFHEISPNRFYSELVVKCATSFITGKDNNDDNRRSYRAFVVMMISVAAFLSFTQSNFTGPVKCLPPMPLMGAFGLKEERGPSGEWLEWETWARNELMLAGSDLRGKFTNLQASDHNMFYQLFRHRTSNKNKEAFIALKEALKFNWKLWEYYSDVAADINNFPQAVEAVKKVLDMTGNKRINYAILERTMQEIEVQSSQNKSSMTNNHQDDRNIHGKCDDSHDDHQLTSSDLGLPRPLGDGRLVELLGNVLQQIEKSGGGAETLGLSARWYKIKGDLETCAEKLVKQVRAYQGIDMWHDGDRFKKFAHASLELCNVYMELFSSTGNQEELIKAEKHLKHIIKQAQHFSIPETEELRGLQACLEDVQQRLHAN